ncbi:hemolysin-III related-domain-containing protein [Zopfochytrium polystomum]|nr:hemolysin-III related-domain-containing protein [Zopfochytrium polystomum]
MQDNPQILTGYRAGYTYHENWISLCHLHNESMNVWTHLVGSVAFLLIAGAVTVDALRSGTWVKVGDTHDKIVLALFLLSFSFTYGASALFHLHLSHSKHAFTVFGCWDYSGISAGVLGTSSAILQFLFTCEPATRTGWQLAVLFVNALGVVGPAFPFWPTPAFRPKRAALYMVSAIVSMGPIAHFIVRHGFAALPNPHEYAAVPEFVAGLAVCFAGVVLYVKRMPERLSPGLFDYFGHSHQIWHALCIVSALLHAHVILSLMVWKSAGSPAWMPSMSYCKL